MTPDEKEPCFLADVTCKFTPVIPSDHKRSGGRRDERPGSENDVNHHGRGVTSRLGVKS